MTDSKSLSRRIFIQSTGRGATALAAMASNAPAVLGTDSPNETIGVGCIGIGVRGGTLVNQVAGMDGVKIVAVCDVYKPHLHKGVERSNNPDVKTYEDYRKLLEDKDVDTVVIATPDHWHSQILIDASNAGKDIYIEKGWTRTLDEAKRMLATIKKNKTVMQLGHQGRESTAGLQAKELIDAGKLGEVTLVRTGRFMNGTRDHAVWRWYGWYDYYVRPNPDDVVRDLNWDLWLGPAPKRPFSMERFWHWRCYWDYGTGGAGDLLSHELDFVQMILGHGIPDACMCSGWNALLHDGREFPDTWNAIYSFEKQNRTVTFDCSMNTSALSQNPEFYGKDAVLKCDSIAQGVRDFEVYVEGTSDQYQQQIKEGKISTNKPFLKFDPSKTPEQPPHMLDFFNCVRSRGKTKCNEDEAFIETVTFLMSVESYHQKRQVRWDPEKQEIV